MITIRVDESNRCDVEYSMYISFDYNQKVVDIIRQLPTRYWNPDNKEWEVPLKKLQYLLEAFSDFDIELTGKYVSFEQPKVELPSDFSFKTDPYEHQIEGFNYGLQHNRWLLGDEMGLGKTKQVIDIAVAKKLIYGYEHCLIVCGVNGLKWNWYNEVKTHSNEQPFILGQRRRKNGNLVIGSANDKMSDVFDIDELPYFIITNIETMRNQDIVAELVKLCKSKKIGMIALDECHKCFDYDTEILTIDGIRRIGDIVTNKIKTKVLSYNETESVYEWKDITNWYENIVNQKLLELQIETENGVRTIRCTDTHRFHTNNRGWVCAKDLTEDDDISDFWMV